MKRNLFFFIIIFFLGVFLASCTKSTTGTETNTESQQNTFVSENVKEQGPQYFSFADNAASSTQPARWDLTFAVQQRTAEVGVNSCVFFSISTDPIIKAGPGVLMARLDSVSLDDVNAVPEAGAFAADDTLREAFIGKNWFDPQNGYQVRPDVYVIQTCEGNYGLVQFRRYDFDFAQMQISNIVFDFKYNADGSTDFSQSVLDSIQTGNGYEQTRYISLAEGLLASAYGTWDLQVEGSSVWLGPNVTAYKLENTNIDSVSSINVNGFSADHLPNYITTDWYDTDESHHVIPKDYVYVVKTSDDKYAAFQVSSYYDAQGNSGAFTIKWKYLAN